LFGLIVNSCTVAKIKRGEERSEVEVVDQAFENGFTELKAE